MTTSFRAITALLLMALAFAACGSDSASVDDPDNAGPDGEWVLDFLLLEGDMAIPLPDRPVDFRIAGSEIGGSAGCNSIGGTAAFGSDGVLAIGDLFWTEMACEPASLMEFEARYTQAMLSVDAWTVDADRLVLQGPGVEITYVPRVAPPDAPIIGTTWQLDTFFDGDSASHQIGMDEVTVRFSEGGVRASGSCWTIDGFATIEPGGEGNLSVDFSTADPGFSCDDRTFFEDMMSRLGEIREYSVDESRLTLGTGGEPVLGLIAAE